MTKSLVFSRISAILGVKNDLKGIAPSRSFKNIKFYRWLKIGFAQKHRMTLYLYYILDIFIFQAIRELLYNSFVVIISTETDNLSYNQIITSPTMRICSQLPKTYRKILKSPYMGSFHFINSQSRSTTEKHIPKQPLLVTNQRQ